MTWTTTPLHLARLSHFEDSLAWREFAAHFEPILARHARRSGVAPDQVQDVVQDTLLAFALALRGGRFAPGRGDLPAWLLGIARREEASTRRRASRALPRAQGSIHAPEREKQPATEESAVEERRRAIAGRCLERVRGENAPSTWECFDLNALQGLGAAAVAARLQITTARVHDTRYRITRRLRQLVLECDGSG